MPTETSPPKRGRKPKQSAPVEPMQTAEQIVRIPLTELHPFPDHPYGIREDQAMQDSSALSFTPLDLRHLLRYKQLGRY